LLQGRSEGKRYRYEMDERNEEKVFKEKVTKEKISRSIHFPLVSKFSIESK
jgi:hypothetical protein